MPPLQAEKSGGQSDKVVHVSVQMPPLHWTLSVLRATGQSVVDVHTGEQ